jgi:mannose-6-phosphate isomerase-like protein (cupin superfamily)
MKHKTSLNECVEFIAGDDTILREILHPDKHAVELRYSLAHFRVLPGKKTKKHSLKTSEIYYIISGKGRMHIGEKEFEVSAHDTVYIPPHSIQFIENLSKTEEIVALCIVDPAWRKDNEIVHE